MKTTLDTRFRAADRFISSREFFGMKLGIDNIRDYLASLGSPQDAFPAVHVAGTNGKGSTVVMLGSILKKAGYKTGVFTSPHLVEFRERIRVNGRRISREYVADFIEQQKPAIKARKITYFETMVALAFSYFKHCGVDIAVIETGLGGRLDATNTLTPLVSVITEISKDHTTILGSTLPKIAAEKGGIIKPGVPVALAPMAQSARRRLEKIAAMRRSPVLNSVTRRALEKAAGSLSLRGAVQRDNLLSVLTVAKYLNASGFRISDSDIKNGLESVRWRGRFERRRGPSGQVIILDVAHNESSIRSFVETFRSHYPGRRAVTVVGFVKQKSHQRQLADLQSISSHLILTALPTRRSMDPRELKDLLSGSHTPVTLTRSPATAFRRGIQLSAETGILVIVGSHYLVGDYIRRNLHSGRLH